MKKIFRDRSFRILLLSVLILLGVLATTIGMGGYSSLGSSIVGGILTPIQTMFSNGIHSLHSSQEKRDETIAALQETIDQLEDQLAKQNEELSDYYQVKRENEQYRQYLGLKSEHQDWEFVSAAVVAKDPNELYQGFTINRGSLSGLKLNDPVITSHGLVGKITGLGANYAKVTTILSPELNVGAINCQTEEIGVVSGKYTLTDQNRTLLQELAPETEISEGDLVVTAGLGGIFPANITIGTVDTVERSATDISRQAVLKPAVEVSEVTNVFVIVSFQGQGEAADDLNRDE